MTGCTFGKGNLLHRDYGKHVYTFVRPADGKAVRVVVRPDYWGGRSAEHEALAARLRAGTATADDRARFVELQEARALELLALPEAQLLEVQPTRPDLPQRQRVADYITCDRCGELVQVIRTRTVDGQRLCEPCQADAEAA